MCHDRQPKTNGDATKYTTLQEYTHFARDRQTSNYSRPVARNGVQGKEGTTRHLAGNQGRTHNKTNARDARPTIHKAKDTAGGGHKTQDTEDT